MTRLLEENALIHIEGNDAVKVVQVLSLVVVSLHKIGASYAVNAITREEYERETTRFIDEWQVTQRLAFARRLLSECFDLTLGPDDMDDLERAAEGIEYWTSPQSMPPKKRFE